MKTLKRYQFKMSYSYEDIVCVDTLYHETMEDFNYLNFITEYLIINNIDTKNLKRKDFNKFINFLVDSKGFIKNKGIYKDCVDKVYTHVNINSKIDEKINKKIKRLRKINQLKEIINKEKNG